MGREGRGKGQTERVHVCARAKESEHERCVHACTCVCVRERVRKSERERVCAQKGQRDRKDRQRALERAGEIVYVKENVHALERMRYRGDRKGEREIVRAREIK